MAPAIIDGSGSVIDISNFVKADDLKNKEHVVTIEKCDKEPIALPGKKPSPCAVMYFVNREKPLIVNTTNLRIVRKLYGPKVADWSGKRITLYPTTTKLRGETVPCIRIKETEPA